MKNSWSRARVMDASDRSYNDLVLPLLARARKEIVLSLYLVDPRDDASPEHPVNRLLEALLAARARGVRIRMVLNTNFRFLPKTSVGEGKYFERLAMAGVEITALLPSRRLHDKLIVIDGRYVIEGSMNWSAAALTQNFESVTIVDSVALAKKKLERIDRLMIPPPPKESAIDRPLLTVPEQVDFPAALFEERYLPSMIRTSDIRAMDLYLILFAQSAAAGKKEIEVDLETLGRALLFSMEWSRSQIRRQVIKVLKKLAERYGLIEYETPYARSARVKVKELSGEKIPVPGRLLEAGYLARASSGAAFLELVAEFLKKEGTEIDALSAPEMERRFGVGASTLIRARQALSAR